MRMTMLPSSKSHSEFHGSSSSEFAAPTPNPTPTNAHDSSDATAHDAGHHDAPVNSASLDDDMNTAASTRLTGGSSLVPEGLHKTPRSVPRSIAVT